MSVNQEPIKIVYIGAGSGAWALRIIRDLTVSKELSNCEIIFVDINKERLEFVAKLAKRYNEVTGGKLKIGTARKLDDALKDASVVVNSVLAGNGHELQEKVRAVSEKYGYYRGIESKEFNMVSDYSTLYSGFDQYNYIQNLTQKMHDVIPDAWLINVANPVFELQTMMSRENKVKSISWCDGTTHYSDIEKFFGFQPNQTEYQMAGINHNIWLTEFLYNGEDQYPRIEKWITDKSESYWKNDPFYTTYKENIHLSDIRYNMQYSRAAVDMYNTYKLFPVGDTVRSGTWKYHYDLETKKKWYGPYGGFDSEIGWRSWLMYLDENNKTMQNLVDAGKERLLQEIPTNRRKASMIPIVPFIEAIFFDKKIRSHFNIKNDNNGEKIIPHLPNDIAVEVPVTVDRKGVHPEQIKNLNDRIIKEILLPRTANMEIALDAFYNGSKDILLDSLYRDPRTKSNEQAKEVLNKVLSLPENSGAGNHYK